MKTITTHNIVAYMKDRFPELVQYLKNGTIDRSTDKCIAVLTGSETRSQPNIAIGGIDCTAVRVLPINIVVHWTTNQYECDSKATEIFDKILCEGCNFKVDDVKIATIDLIDSCPIQTGRDNKNVCESTIRANVFYYV